jgi:hypothetical protein
VGPAGHSALLRGGVGSTFLRSSSICPILLDQCERLPHIGTARRKRMSGVREMAWKVYMDWCGKHTYCVYRVSPIGCTLIRIAATLRYE